MDILYKLIINFEDKLNNEEIIKELNKCYITIRKDNKLIEKIRKYQISKDLKLKEEIENNDSYKVVRRLEANLNLMILEINQELNNLCKNGDV